MILRSCGLWCSLLLGCCAGLRVLMGCVCWCCLLTMRVAVNLDLFVLCFVGDGGADHGLGCVGLDLLLFGSDCFGI